MTETWKKIPGFGGSYKASDTGRIWSDKTKRILTQQLHVRGYLQVRLYHRGKGRTLLVHRLVAAAWLRRIPRRMVVNHKSGAKTDNCVANLEIVTHRENVEHAVRLGLTKHGKCRGERNGRAKLTFAKVRMMRQRHQEGVSIADLARQYGVSHTVASAAIKGRTWRHVDCRIQEMAQQTLASAASEIAPAISA